MLHIMACKIVKTIFIQNPIKRSSFTNLLLKEFHTNPIPVKEIQIPTQWGFIAGKLWGSEHHQPILALHGWQDNAGTWDPLAPLLVKGCSILSIDFPGHGLSSWLPPGLHYYTWDLPRLILYLKEHFKWDKITLLCHSLGSIAGLRFASLFPEAVDAYIAIDSLVSDDYDLDFVVDKYRTNLQKIEIEQTRLDVEPPSYSLEEITKLWHLGTRKSVSLESVKYLLTRGSKPSKVNPGKFYFSRDSRLKYVLFSPEDRNFKQALALKLKAPTLYVKATDSPYSADAFSVEMRKLIAENNKDFEFHSMPGTHHVHLNNPEKVAPLIIPFLKKHNLYNEDGRQIDIIT